MDLLNKSVLLVEDNKTAQILCSSLLKKIWIAKYDLAENWQEAVDMANKKLYDIILMDIQMPIMDGVEATQKIRKLEKWNHPKIIAYTAYDNNFELGESFDWKIQKPANIISFNEVIYDVLSKE